MLAADYQLWVRDPPEMYQVERRRDSGGSGIGTKRDGVLRVVYTSSVATMGFTELMEFLRIRGFSGSLADMIGHYKRSKFMAEQVALAMPGAWMHVVTVNPTTPIGERDVKLTPTGRIVLDFMKRKFPAMWKQD